MIVIHLQKAFCIMQHNLGKIISKRSKTTTAKSKFMLRRTCNDILSMFKVKMLITSRKCLFIICLTFTLSFCSPLLYQWTRASSTGSLWTGQLFMHVLKGLREEFCTRAHMSMCVSDWKPVTQWHDVFSQLIQNCLLLWLSHYIKDFFGKCNAKKKNTSIMFEWTQWRTV